MPIALKGLRVAGTSLLVPFGIKKTKPRIGNRERLEMARERRERFKRITAVAQPEPPPAKTEVETSQPPGADEKATKRKRGGKAVSQA